MTLFNDLYWIESVRELDEWMIMPNHIHAIIIINDKQTDGVETPRNRVSTITSSVMNENYQLFENISKPIIPKIALIC